MSEIKSTFCSFWSMLDSLPSIRLPWSLVHGCIRVPLVHQNCPNHRPECKRNVATILNLKNLPNYIFNFWNRLHSVLLLLESALFGLFVIAIMVDQMHAILYDETAVESVQLKGQFRPTYRPKLMRLAEVCGRGHPALWLLPCTNSGQHSHHSSSRSSYEVPLLHDV